MYDFRHRHYPNNSFRSFGGIDSWLSDPHVLNPAIATTWDARAADTPTLKMMLSSAFRACFNLRIWELSRNLRIM